MLDISSTGGSPDALIGQILILTIQLIIYYFNQKKGKI